MGPHLCKYHLKVGIGFELTYQIALFSHVRPKETPKVFENPSNELRFIKTLFRTTALSNFADLIRKEIL